MKEKFLGLLLLVFPFVIHAQNLFPPMQQIYQTDVSNQAETSEMVTRTVSEISAFSLQPTEEEFPLWAKDLRRAEIITFGSFPFTLLFATVGMDMYLWATNDWDPRYAPIVRPAGAVEMSVDQRLMTLGIALGASIVVATVDHIIIRVKRSNAAKRAAALPVGDPIIIRRPLDDLPAEDSQEE